MVVKVGVIDTVLFDEPAEEPYVSVLHECELGPADLLFHEQVELRGVKAIPDGRRIKHVVELCFGVGLVTLDRDMDDSVVSEIDVSLFERVAVGDLVGAVGGYPQVHDTGIVLTDALESLIELNETHSTLVEAVGGHEPEPVGVGACGQHKFSLGGHFYALWLNQNYAHRPIRFSC